MGIVRTGKMVDQDTLTMLRGMARDAAATPVILLRDWRLGPNGKTEDQYAREYFRAQLNGVCVKYGFPEPAKDEDGDVIDYGLDFETGEILEWDGKP